MKQKLQRLKGDRTISHLFLKAFMLLAFMLSGMGGVRAAEVNWTASQMNFYTAHSVSIVDRDVTSTNCSATKNGIGSENLEVGGKTYYKLSSNSGYVKITKNEGKFKAGDVLSVDVALDESKALPVSFKLNAEGASYDDRPNAKEVKLEPGQSTIINYILQQSDINSDGSVSIYRAGGTGYACRYYNFTVKSVDESKIELSSNTDVVSVKLNSGAWDWNSGRKGITTYEQGTNTEMGSCIVIRPKVEIELSLTTYSSLSNCNLVMCEDWNVLKDFRQKGERTNDFGTLQAGHTYYIFGKSFKNENFASGLEYIFFKSFKVTYPGFAKVGNADFSSGFGSVYSEFREILPNKEYVCEFVNHGNGENSWNNFNLVVSSESNRTSDLFVLRADNWVWGTAAQVQSGVTNPSNVQLKGGGAINWDTYISDLEGAYVKSRTSFSGNHVSVYNEITNNGRTYIQTYVSKQFENKDKVYVSYTVDHSVMSIVYRESWNDVYSLWLDEGMQNGTAAFELVNGTKIPNGFMAEANSDILVTPIPNSGYMFQKWGASGEKDNPRIYNMNANRTVYADFLKLTDWDLKVYGVLNGSESLYYGNSYGEIDAWRRNTHFYTDNLPNGVYEGAYLKNGGNLKEYSHTEGLRFNNNVRIKYHSSGAEILLNPQSASKNGGALRIPVTAGEIVRITAASSKDTDLPIVNADGSADFLELSQATNTYSVVAKATGYVELTNIGKNNVYIYHITKDWKADFEFADGNETFAISGTDGYVNEPVDINALGETSFHWISSNSADVQVEPYSGKITVREGYVGTVTITATMMSEIYPYVAKSYTLKVVNQNIAFEDEFVTLQDNGTYTGLCQIPSNLPTGAKVTYSIVDKNAKNGASVTNNGTNWVVSIFGKTVNDEPSTTIVRATCGALVAEYTITADGFVFAKNKDIYRYSYPGLNSGEYRQTIAGATKYTMQKFGNIANTAVAIDESTGLITGLPVSQDNNGGTLVVKAEDNGVGENKHSATYVLTIPYLEHVWNFYKEGQITGGDVNNRLTTGELVNSTNPGSAFLVSCLQENSSDSIDISSLTLKPLKTKPGEIYSFKTDLRKWMNWRNHQNGTLSDNDSHKYWNFTFKTFSHVYGDPKTLTYTNEPLFSYKKAIDGDNVRVVKNTEGLVFVCGADCFGINDNPDGTIILDDHDNAQDTREKDRAVIIKGDESKLIIPGVKANYYVKLHWYRHSDNAGDQFTVTNAKDLDGKLINPTDKLRFTGAHYTHHNYEGSTILQAASDGDIEITIANQNWTELYRIEVMEKYETDQRLCQVNVFGEGASRYASTGMQNERDLNNPAHYNWENDGDPETVDGPRITAYLTSKIKTHKNGGDFIECAPDFYISAYPGQAYTWNGWRNTKVSVEASGTAICNGVDPTTHIGVLPIEDIWVGERLRYQMHHVKDIKGTGTFRLTFRTITGWAGEPAYTLNKQDAYVAVGEYSVQDYPYTWDFTDYNTGLYNDYGESSYTYNDIQGKDSPDYGGWASSESDKYTMSVYRSDFSTTIGGELGTANPVIDLRNNYRNKPLFAQGSQLAVGENANHTLLETEGLRVYIPEVTPGNNSAVEFMIPDPADPSDPNVPIENNFADEGYLKVVAGSKITIPEVDKDMYVFVKSDKVPTFTNTTTQGMEPFVANSNVTFRKATGNAEGGKADVQLAFSEDTKIYKIGVTNEIKAIRYYGYATESRAVDIDYNETRYFSAPMSMYYVTNVDGWDQRSDEFNLGDDLEVKTEASTATIKNRYHIPDGTGIIVKNDAVDYKKEQGNTYNGGKDYIVPLFYPACNVRVSTGDEVNPESNKLVATTSASQASAEIQPTLEDDSKQYYTLNISYVEVGREDNDIKADQVYTSIPRFYRFVGSGKGDSNTYTLVNKAYLELDKPAGVKAIDFFDINFNFDTPEEAPTSVEAADVIDNNNENGIYYNLRGQAVNGKPTVGGIYIKNGKKYYVK